MDLIGIENEAEFFPAGTLSDVLKEELRDITARWAGLEKTAHPVERLTQGSRPCVEKLRQLRNTAEPARQQDLIRDIHNALVEALGYPWKPDTAVTAFNGHPIIPLVSRMADSSGRDALWILQAPITAVGDEATDPLSVPFTPEQFPEALNEVALTDRSIEELLADGVFALPNGPRHVLILGLSQLVLIDSRKWPARSVLRFDLQEIFTRADPDTLTVMACLVAREARVPDQGVPLSDRLEEEAQRNANAVTASLKSTVRDAIEILGQEVLDVAAGKYPSNYPDERRRGVWIDGPELSRECLRYMYRLLFLFYAEANPRLKLLDLSNPIYATGYSLETLRELESIPLRSLADREGSYLWESLQITLNLIYEGIDIIDEHKGKGLRFPTIKVSLLDPQSTPLLNRLCLRNEAIQKVIRLLSLRSTGKSTGRISYAKLGIGQLGAVYETLISFTGVVAKTDLIELKPRTGRTTSHVADDDRPTTDGDETENDGDDLQDAAPEDEVFRRDTVDLLAPSWFVPRSRIGEFDSKEIVFKGAEALVYPKGTFIYRLAGRDREKSASYYTQEALARLLVKHALMALCQNLSADELLELKILEPAMGSAAFLVETTNQLADLYLERKQKEVGRTIPQDQVIIEKQKVRAYIADRNCFGVDLNPIATELGAISLWLNSLHDGAFSPWFGNQLHAGNSLIGARRAAYAPALLTANKQADLWLTAKPDEIGWRQGLPSGYVWQWLLPAKDMANFDKDKSIAPFAKEAQDTLKAWRKGVFFKKLAAHEIKLVQKLSRVAETLFHQVAKDLARARSAVTDEITLWPDKVMPGSQEMDFYAKARLNDRLTGADHASNTLPYKRLKTAMDAWCALWLWPLDKAHQLPDRAVFLQSMAMILEGGFTADGALAVPSMREFQDATPDLFADLLPQASQPTHKTPDRVQGDLFRETNVEALIENFDWLKTASEVAERERFIHFDLLFADVMQARGGFDLIVGNPPWVKPSWNEGLILADIDPFYAGLSATEARKVLAEALAKADSVRREGRLVSATEAFLKDFVSARGAMEVTSSEVMNPFAGGGSNNLYRCFIDLAFRLVAPQGYVALIHQDGHLGDPKSGAFRRHWYGRIVKHFEFINRMKSKNFSEVDHNVRFSLNIYRGVTSKIHFEKFTYAFSAAQIEDSYSDRNGIGLIPSIKNSDGNWDTRGHRDRVMRIDQDALAVIHALSEDETVPIEEARFIQPYSARTLDVFRQMAQFPKLDAAIPKMERIVRTASGERKIEIPLWQMSAHWNETASQKDGTIRRETAFRDADQMILQGPLFHVGNPLYKTPRSVSRTNADYDVIDLMSVPDDYLPRTNYGPAIDMDDYRERMTRCRWDSTKSHADFYRVAFRNMINLNSERSLIAALIPKGASHVHTVESVAFNDVILTLVLHSLSVALPYDFLIKASGRGHIHDSDMARLPWIKLGSTAQHRSLRLACLTAAYADLWNQHAPHLTVWPWSSSDSRLSLEGSVQGPNTWDRTAGLRTEFARRMALVEIDVLVAQALGLTVEQLIEIYRIYFPVLQENEAGTWYDQQGRIVWTCSKGLPGVGWLDEKGKSPGRAAWEKMLAHNPSELTCTAIDATLPGGAREITRHFVGPFTCCDRTEDYQRAWVHFEQLKAHENT